MTITKALTEAPETDDATHLGDDSPDQARSYAGRMRVAIDGAADRLPVMLASARSGADQVATQLPAAVDRARVGVEETTTTLQTMPDGTLQLFAAASIGLATGLYIAGMPRLITLAAIAPALLAGGAIARRPGRSSGKPS